MRWIIGGKAVERGGASTSQMGRFETEMLATHDNLAALADLSGAWIDRVHGRHPPKIVVLDTDSSGRRRLRRDAGGVGDKDNDGRGAC